MESGLGDLRRRVQRVSDLDDPRVAAFRNLKDARLHDEWGLFIVEGHLLVRRLLVERRLRTRALLLSEKVLDALAPELVRHHEAVSVYVAAQATLDAIAGFHLHRGCLAAVERGAPRSVAELLPAGRGRSLLVVLEGLMNHDNVGGVFRNAMAFAADAVLLCPRCCDPLYRKAVRVSMGGALHVPFARFDEWPRGLDELRHAGYEVVALHPGEPSHSTGSFSARLPARAALLLGTEGKGLSRDARAGADWSLRIPMADGVDSLNVATAAGIAMAEHFARSVDPGRAR